MMHKNILESIANTPILKLNNIGNGNIYVKLEKLNPAGSVKDRPVYYMIKGLEERGILKEGDVLVEATSGNTGLALAMIGRIKGYEVILVMPETMSVERRELMKSYGAKLVLTEGKKGMKGAIEKAKELIKENENYKSIGQFDNEDNVKAHYETTGPEIYKDLNDIDIFTCGVGTGGTISGVGKYLKQQNEYIKIVALEPKNSPTISENKSGPHKIQGIGAGFIPSNYKAEVVDEVITVEDNDAFNMVRELAEKEGLLVGISSGANIFGALELSKKYPDKKIVTIVCDGIEKYISLEIFK